MKILSIIFLLLVTLPAFSVEILEEGQKSIKTTIDGEILNESVISYRVIRARFVEIYYCDFHPDDPLCENTGEYYYDFTSYKYIEKLKKEKNDFKYTFRNYTNEEVHPYTWGEILDSSVDKTFANGIVIIYWSTNNGSLPKKILKTIADKHLQN